MEGWAGKILEINLTDGSIKTHTLDEDLKHLFLGGRGLGARLLWDLVGPKVDPLSPANALIFAAGPLTASGVQTSNRFTVTTKSPLTGTILDANSGGWWGMQFKRTGHDALIIRGKAAHPVIIEINHEGVFIKSAGDLWGQSVSATTNTLGQDDNRRNVLCIGPAGENLCRMASIMNDGTRALGRGGPGAVMGSKNLKAIIVVGSLRNRPADPELFRLMLYEAGKLIKANPVTSQALPEFGTNVVMNVINHFGVLPTRNFQKSQFEGAEDISGERLAETLLVHKKACWACPIACTRVTKTKREEGEGPEYETTWAFGAQCGIRDLEVIAEAGYLCNDLGLDTISTGNTIGCAMELGERGWVDTDLAFGHPEMILPMINDIAHRRGLGDKLAEGSYRFAETLGASEFSMSVKKMEIPAYDPRGMQGQALLFATSNRGACHMRGNMLGPEILALPRLVDRFATKGKAGFVAIHQDSAAVVDSLGVCKFANLAINEEYFARLLSSITNIPFSADDLMRVGERIWNLERLYNLREGFTRSDDTLPDRLLNQPVDEGPSAGFNVNLPPMLDEYYRFRNWSLEGVPSQAKLKELDLEDFIPSPGRE